MGNQLSTTQTDVLQYLNRCEYATQRTIERNVHRSRSSTLDVLVRAGFVERTLMSPVRGWAGGGSWHRYTITAKGRLLARSLNNPKETPE